jgi:O-acetyl-ADP-ribose deacetylase (regulator of RNase III)
MTKEYKKIESGNILQITEGVIVHQTNCQGVFGGGIALKIKKLYPDVYEEYHSHCIKHLSSELMGTVLYVRPKARHNLIIANAFGQNDYGTHERQTNYEALTRCFESVNSLIEPEIHIHYPLIGCGLGGGSWKIVSAIIDETLKERPHTLWMFP